MALRLAAPSVATTDGAKNAVSVAPGLPLSIVSSNDRRITRARPTVLPTAILLTAAVISLTGASFIRGFG